MVKNWSGIKILAKDKKRMDKLKLIPTEPYWSILKRLLDSNKPFKTDSDR